MLIWNEPTSETFTFPAQPMARPIHRQEKALFPHITQVLPALTHQYCQCYYLGKPANITSKGGVSRWPKKSAKLQNWFITDSGLGAIWLLCNSALYCCPYSLQISIGKIATQHWVLAMSSFKVFFKLLSFVDFHWNHFFKVFFFLLTCLIDSMAT